MTRYILPLLLTGCATTSQQVLLTALPGPPSVVHLEPVEGIPRCVVRYESREQLGAGVRECLKGK